MVKPSVNGNQYDRRRSVGQNTLRLAWALVLCQVVAASPALADAPTTVTLHDVVVTPEEPRIMNFPIERSGDLGRDLLLHYHTTDVTAKAGADYTGATGTLLLPAGTASAGIPVSLSAAAQNFDDRSFRLWLDSAAAVGPAPAFAAPQQFATGQYPGGFAVADVNGDGRPDVIVGGAGVGPNQFVVDVYLNTTPHGAAVASFAAPVHVAQNSSGTIALVDLNGDGRPDLIKADSDHSGFSRTISVLMNATSAGASTPVFGSPQKFSFATRNIASLSSIVAIDVNSDGRLDLAVCEAVYHSIEVFVNTTDPGAGIASFAAAQWFDAYVGGGSDARLVAVDLNQDGKTDLVVAASDNDINGPVAILLNATVQGSGTAAFRPPNFVPVGAAQSIAVNDINADGIPDLVVADAQDIASLVNTTPPGAADVTFAVEQFSQGSGALTLAIADFNGDGKADLALGRADSSTRVLDNASAHGGSTTDFLPMPDFYVDSTMAVAVGDVNGDGRPDIVSLAALVGGFTVLLNTSSATGVVSDAAILGSPALGVIQGERIFLDGFE